MSEPNTSEPRQSTVSPEKLAEIIAWGRANLPPAFLENTKLVTLMYNKKHTAAFVKDCVGGARAKLTLLFVTEFEPRTVEICKKCKRKKCSDDCGEQAYTPMVGYSYLAGDPTGNILVKVAPWEETIDHDKIEMEKVYEVEGFIDEYNGKISIQAKKISPVNITVASSNVEVKTVATASSPKIDQQLAAASGVNEKAVASAKKIISIFDNAIEEHQYFDLMGKQGYTKDVAEAAISTAGAKRELLAPDKCVISL